MTQLYPQRLYKGAKLCMHCGPAKMTRGVVNMHRKCKAGCKNHWVYTLACIHTCICKFWSRSYLFPGFWNHPKSQLQVSPLVHRWYLVHPGGSNRALLVPGLHAAAAVASVP